VLVIAGGVLQVLGFATVALELWRVQRREFGTPERLTRMQQWLRRRILRRPLRNHVTGGSATASSHGTLRARVRRKLPESASVEQRVAVIEGNLARLDAEVAEHGEALDRQRAELHTGLGQVRAQVEHQHNEREKDRKRFLRGTIDLQLAGTVSFVIGTVLGVVGSTT
jgi:hypothetical protein